MDRLSDLALFLRVLDLGSISAAARALDLSPALASKRLQRLERELGVRLLHRTTRRLHATPDGEQLAERSRPLLAELARVGQGLRHNRDAVQGELRVAASATFARRHVAPHLAVFLQQHEDVRISLHCSDQFVDLIDGGFDLALRFGKLPDSSFVTRRLAITRRLVCASPDYIARHGVPSHPSQLARHRCLILSGSGGRQDLWRFGTPQGEVAVRVQGPLESNFGDALREATLAGAGIALHSTWHVEEELRRGRLRPLLLDFPLAEIPLYALLPQRSLVPARVRAFVEFLQQRFGDPPYWERGLDLPATTVRRR
jgi:DNA-binding transcriptional LysR family regulator